MAASHIITAIPLLMSICAKVNQGANEIVILLLGQTHGLPGTP
jgi:hypothetical protein